MIEREQKLRELIAKWREWAKELAANGQIEASRIQKADADELEATLAAEPGQAEHWCPSCRATDNHPYENEYGQKMRACGRCMIQWAVQSHKL